MHFFKTLPTLAVSMATLAAAVPMPGVFNAEVGTSGFVEEVASPTATAAPSTAAAASLQQPSQQDKDVDVATAGASSAATVLTTVTLPAGASAPTTAAAAAATSSAASVAFTTTVEQAPSAASQPSSTAAAPTTTVAASSAPSAPSSSAASPSSSSGSSSGSSSSSSTGGSGLTIINNCPKDVQASESQGLSNSGVGSTQTLSANGGTAHFDMSGASQTVKVYWAGVDIYSGTNTNSEIEWTLKGNTVSYDLSLLTGNPFLQYGQKLESPCAINGLANSNTISCGANSATCNGAYFPGYAQDATQTCDALAQGQGLTYTLCES